jgi:hypothetical protein
MASADGDGALVADIQRQMQHLDTLDGLQRANCFAQVLGSLRGAVIDSKHGNGAAQPTRLPIERAQQHTEARPVVVDRRNDLQTRNGGDGFHGNPHRMPTPQPIESHQQGSACRKGNYSAR